MNNKPNWTQVLTNDLVTIRPRNKRRKPIHKKVILICALSLFAVHNTLGTDEIENQTDVDNSNYSINLLDGILINELKFENRALTSESIKEIEDLGFIFTTIGDNCYYFKNEDTGYSIEITRETIIVFKNNIHQATFQRTDNRYIITSQPPDANLDSPDDL